MPNLRRATRLIARLFTTCFASLALSLGCKAFATESITIAAAADLRFAMPVLIAQFQQRTLNAKVHVIYGSSGKLHTQIQQGAPFDLFFSADSTYPKRLMKLGLAASPVTLYARGKLALWFNVPTLTIASSEMLSITALASPKIQKIAIANPRHAPYGLRAEQALKATGLWHQLESKLILGEDIAQTSQFIMSGNAQAGFVSLSMLHNPTLQASSIQPSADAIRTLKTGQYLLVPESLYTPLDQAFIITKRAHKLPLAKQFADFMLTHDAQLILTNHGFSPAQPNLAPILNE